MSALPDIPIHDVGGYYQLPNGLLSYGAGVGLRGEDKCLIVCIEIDDEQRRWAHVIDLRHVERVPVDDVVHIKTGVVYA